MIANHALTIAFDGYFIGNFELSPDIREESPTLGSNVNMSAIGTEIPIGRDKTDQIP